MSRNPVRVVYQRPVSAGLHGEAWHGVSAGNARDRQAFKGLVVRWPWSLAWNDHTASMHGQLQLRFRVPDGLLCLCVCAVTSSETRDG